MSLPVAVTTMTPLPWVTGVCMNAMSVCSPGREVGPLRDLDALRRRHTLAGQRGLVDLQRARLDDPAVGRHLITGGQQDDIADDHLLGGISASDPSRRTRAVAFTIALSAFIALSALPSWRRPTTALSDGDQRSAGRAVLHSLITSETMAAPTRIICM